MATQPQEPHVPLQEQTVGQVIREQLSHNIKQYAMFIALIAVWLLFTALTGGIFLSARNITNLFLQASHIAVLAVGMVLIIVAGHIDLSVGSIMGFIGAVAAVLNVNAGWPVIPVIVVSLALGVLIGLWQGYWVAYRGIPAFIVTLAGMTIFRGGIIAVTGGATIAPLDDAFRAIGQGYVPRILNPEARTGFHEVSAVIAVIFIVAFVIIQVRNRRTRVKYGFDVLPPRVEALRLLFISAIIGLFFGTLVFYRGIPYVVLIILALVLFYTFLAENTVFGRQVYAMGGNKEAARLSGINIRQRTLAIFVSMGTLSALAGIVFTARLNAAGAQAGTLVELDTIAATIIGGTSVRGGEGTIFGAIIGALLMASVNNGMSLMNLSSDVQMIVRGAILLLAVWFDISSRKIAD